MTRQIRIISIQTGTPVKVSFNGKEYMTSMNKQPVHTPLYLSRTNLAGDAQADLVHHGGPDKAVCVYAFDHYPYWEKVLNRPLSPAAFGENLTVAGLAESDVCIGDVFQLGEAVVQVSQPRQPCYKLAVKYGVADLPLQVQNTGYTGFYFRVLQEGQVWQNGPFHLIERHSAGVTISEANRIMHRDKHDRDGILRILEVAELSESWRKTLTKRLAGETTNENERLKGPDRA